MIDFSFSLTYIELYLLVVNTFAFLLYAFDKFQSLKNDINISRVPELRLLIATALGGVVGSLLAMVLLRHKIKKTSFMLKILSVFVLQGIVIYLYYTNIL